MSTIVVMSLPIPCHFKASFGDIYPVLGLACLKILSRSF